MNSEGSSMLEKSNDGPVSKVPSHTNATILVVDDEPAVLKVLVTRLELSGYTVVSAKDGEEALDGKTITAWHRTCQFLNLKI